MSTIKDQVLPFVIQTSLSAYNEHVTDIVALKLHIWSLKGSIPEELHKVLMDIVMKVHAFDKSIWDSLDRSVINTAEALGMDSNKIFNLMIRVENQKDELE